MEVLRRRENAVMKKRRIKNEKLLSFSLGLLVSSILPSCWVVVVVAVVLIVSSFCCSGCRCG